MQLKSKILLTFLNLVYFIKSNQCTRIEEFSNSKTCECVPFLLCENGTEIINGVGLLDIRSYWKGNPKYKYRDANECKNYLEVCCEPPYTKPTNKDPSSLLQVGERGCGIRNYGGVELKILNQNSYEAEFGEFPWMVAILRNTLNELDVFECGGSIIHRKVVLTAAHCVYGKIASSIKIRAGEWDTQATNEIISHQDRAVEAIVIHENYHSRALYNDIALLILSSAVQIVQNVDVICLPESNYEFIDSRCTATGWGKNKFGRDGQHQGVLKDVQLSLVSRTECQNTLRRTRLGGKFQLHESFLCAGGIEAEDTCEGDGGGPLICPLKKDPERFVQVGIVSWGIDCGTNLPGIYTDVLSARSWIDEQLMFHNFDNTVYQHEQYVEEADF